MVKRTLLIQSAGDFSLESRQLTMNLEGERKQKAPLEDLAHVVVDNVPTRWTGSLIAACGANGTIITFCGEKHLPESYVIPVVGHSLTARTQRLQVEASKPTKKRIWQQVVSAKVGAQARNLTKWTGSDAGLTLLSKLVRSGDPDNVEAVAASRYFEQLFGDEFIREQDTEEELNSRLNYGYALIRAATVRSVVLCGLNPVFGVFHHNRFNPFALADDLMEPLRPMVDDCVMASREEFPDDVELNPPLKRYLLRVLAREVHWEGVSVPLDHALQRYAVQVRDVLLGDRDSFQCPIV